MTSLASFTLHHFDKVDKETFTRLHNLGLYDGENIRLIQRYPFHGPVIIENNHQRIALRYHVFATLTGEWQMEIALIGNPNTGKTTLFNSLTNNYATTGNWTGVTVDQKVGTLKHATAKVIDLPGVYSLTPLTRDEEVVTLYLLEHQPDLILNVTNASQLKRNLLLTLEVREFGQPMILNLNMIDDLKRQGQAYDFDTLSYLLGCPVMATNARNQDGVKELDQALQYEPAPLEPLELDYPPMVKQAIRQATEALVEKYELPVGMARWLTIQYMNQNKVVRRAVAFRNLQPLLKMRAYYDAQHFEEKIFNTRLDFIETVLAKAKENLSNQTPKEFSNKVDKIITNPILGLPIFALIFLLIFELSFDWVGTPLSDALDSFISGPFSTGVDHWLTAIGALPPLRSLVVNGIIAGVGGVLVFIPQIVVLFACISILEDSGYMARAALVTDRIMQTIGLNGKSFIPLIIGFGCNVTGIMAARTIEQPKERLVTTLISPFMSCSARLPIYSLVVAAFFPNHQALVVLSIYFLGIVVALAVAKGYQLFFHTTDSSVFIVELPEYHLPRFDVIWQGTWDKSKGFIRKAGTVIFAGSVLIWLLSSFGTSGFVTDPTKSFAANLGQFLVPVLAPLGITHWQVISALFTGVLAKEVITSSMMVMFHAANQAVLIGALGTYMTPVAAYALLAFILLYSPCFATLGTIKQETGSTKWMLWSLVLSLMIAYVVATVIYLGGTLIFV